MTSPNNTEESGARAESALDGALQTRLDALDGDPRFDNLHAVVVVRAGQRVAERYFSGSDERWGQSLGQVAFSADTLHDLRSISKSVVGLLYGIALDEGAVLALEQPLLDGFPEFSDLQQMPQRRAITVAHALTMQTGLQWNEDLPYSDPNNAEHAMELAANRCRFALDRSIDVAPGTRWRYSGGATALLAELIVRGTGKTLLDYAREKLFAPLGIHDVEWVCGRDGVEIAASGLRMRPRDLARLGVLVMNDGVYENETLIPRAWIAASLRAHAQVDGDIDYGYHWWIARRWRWCAAFGNGGQRMTLLPKANVVLVVTAGNYNAPDAWKVPVAVLTDVLVPWL